MRKHSVNNIALHNKHNTNIYFANRYISRVKDYVIIHQP